MDYSVGLSFARPLQPEGTSDTLAEPTPTSNRPGNIRPGSIEPPPQNSIHYMYRRSSPRSLNLPPWVYMLKAIHMLRENRNIS